jgi:hypothetical protein
MDKSELLETIRVQHRQLTRYIFYFKKNGSGLFVASNRPKFGAEEMQHCEVFMNWSMKDLLSHIIECEQRFIGWYHAGLEHENPMNLLPPDLRWDDIHTDDFPIPADFQIRSVQKVLSDFKDSYQQISSTVASIPEDALFTPGHYVWAGQAPLAEYVALCTYRHYAWAKKLIRRWRNTHAGKYLNKEVCLKRIQSERKRLIQNLDKLSEEQMEVPGVVGEWMVKDILAHLADWEQRFIGWYEAGLRGEVPETPAPGIRWQQLDVLNQRIYEKHHHRNLEDVGKYFDQSYSQVLATIESIPESDMFAPGKYAWLGESSLITYILANTANHYLWAKREIRNWLKSRGEL